MGKIMGRGLSQVLYNYLPGKTFDVEGGRYIGIVTKIIGEDIKGLKDKNKMFSQIKEYLDNWDKEYQKGFENLKTRRDNYIFEKPKSVKFDIFPLVYKCPKCKRVYTYKSYKDIRRKNPKLICKHNKACNNVKLRQIYHVAIHKCGAIKGLHPIRPNGCNCNDWKQNIKLDDRQSQKLSEFRWVCDSCGREAELFYICDECDDGGVMTVIPHRASKSFYVHTIRCVDVADSPHEDSWKKDVSDYLNIEESSHMSKKTLMKLTKGLPESIKGDILRNLEYERKKSFDFDSIPKNKRGILHEYMEIVRDSNDMGVIPLTSYIKQIEDDYPRKASILQEYKNKYLDLGFQEILLIPKFPVITAIFGWSRVDMRPEVETESTINKITLNSFKYSSDTNGKTPIYVDNGQCEAIMFKIDPMRVIQWLRENSITVHLKEDNEDNARMWILQNMTTPSVYGDIPKNDIKTQLIYTLIHSLAHIMMKGIAGISGFELIGLSEYLFPEQLSFVIYSNKTDFSIGGMHTLFETQLDILRRRILSQELSTCLHDPYCIQEGGSCLACIQVPEISCSIFNKNLSRTVIYQQSHEDITAFWKGKLIYDK